MSLRFTIPLVAVLFAAMHAEPALAQFGGRGGGGPSITGGPEHVQQVVVSNAEGLDGSVVALIADSIARRLYAENTVKQILLQPAGGRMSKTMEIQLLVIGFADGKADPLPLWEKARAELERALRRVQQRTHEARVNDHEEKQARVLALLQEAHQNFAKTTAELAKEDSGADGDIESMRSELRKLTSQVRELGLEQIGNAARRKAIESRIDELREIGKLESKDDPIVAELREVVVARENVVESRKMLEQVGSRGSDPRAFSEAVAALAEARIQLLKGERDSADRGLGAMIPELNNELSTLMINAAELAERQKAIEEQIAMLREQTNPRRVAELEMLTTRVELALAQLKEAEMLRAKLDREPPPVLQQITIRPLEEALLGDDAEAPPAESP